MKSEQMPLTLEDISVQEMPFSSDLKEELARLGYQELRHVLKAAKKGGSRILDSKVDEVRLNDLFSFYTNLRKIDQGYQNFAQVIAAVDSIESECKHVYCEAKDDGYRCGNCGKDSIELPKLPAREYCLMSINKLPITRELKDRMLFRNYLDLDDLLIAAREYRPEHIEYSRTEPVMEAVFLLFQQMEASGCGSIDGLIKAIRANYITSPTLLKDK